MLASALELDHEYPGPAELMESERALFFGIDLRKKLDAINQQGS